MFGRRGVVLCFLPTAAAFHANGTAPFANDTSTASSALDPSSTPWRNPTSASDGSTTITAEAGLPKPTPASASISSTNSTYSTNSTNDINSTSALSPCTVNIPNANLEWWYAATYGSAVGTLTTEAANFTNDGAYLTMIPNTETFDISSAISSDVAWTESVVHDSEFGDWTNLEPYLVTPTAGATSIITRNAATPLPSGNIIPASDSLSYLSLTALPPATIAIARMVNSTSAATSATPFLYFTAYEVESTVNGTATTTTVSLAQPSAIEYRIKGIEDSASVTGTLPDGFLDEIPQSTCTPGTVQGEVTVLVVLDLYWLYRPPSNPFLIHFESSALGFETDTNMNLLEETSTREPFTMAPVDPKWTEGLGEKSTADDKPRPQTTSPQLTQGVGDSASTENRPGPQQTGPAPAQNADTKLSNVMQPKQTVGTIGTNPVIVAPSSVVIVGTQTLKPGAPAITVDGRPVSLAPSATAIVVGSTTSALPLVANPGSPSQTVGSVGSRPVVVNPSSAVIIGTATLRPGQPAVTIDGNIVSIAPSATAIVVEGATSTLPRVIPPPEPIQTQAPAPPVLTIGSSTLTANAATQFLISPGQTLTPGGSATIDGTVVSLGPSASFVVVGGSTQILPTGSSGATPQPEIVVGGTTITALAGGSANQRGDNPLSPGHGAAGPTFVISGQTLAPGHDITVEGTTISLEPSGSFIVVNGVTSTLSTPAAAQVTAPPITIGKSIYTPLPGAGTSYMIGSALLTPGGEITVSGSTISLAVDGSDMVINGVTATLHGETHATITNPPLLTIGSQTYTAAPGTGTTFIIGGQTLTPGGTITVDGTTIVLAPGATELVYGSAGKSTATALFPATTRAITTGSVSAPASAGATGGSGGPAPTSSAEGVGCNLQKPGINSWFLSLVVGVLGLTIR